MSSKSWIVVSMIALAAVALAPAIEAQMVPDGEGGYMLKPEQNENPGEPQLMAPNGAGPRRSILQIPAPSFVPRFVEDRLDYFTNGYMYNPDASSGFYHASVYLPAGANVTFLDLYAYDDDAGADVAASLRCYSGGDFDGNPPSFTTIYDVSSSGDSGYGYFFSLFGGHTINNDVAYNEGCQYHVTVSLPPDLGFKGVDLWWERVVSPAPDTASFGDVPTDHVFFRFVEALVDSGITGGCGGGNYCPDDPITRGQMAVFMAAAFGLDWYDNGN